MSKLTLRGIIERIVASTGADPAFAEDLSAVFIAKDIDLASDGSPYEQAVRETCELQAELAATKHRSLKALEGLESTFDRIRAGWQRLSGELRQLEQRANLQVQRFAALAAADDVSRGLSQPSWLMRRGAHPLPN